MQNLQISNQYFVTVIAAVTLIKLGFAIFIPAQYAEAYYVLQSQHLSPIYFDQPPMVAWLISLLSVISDKMPWLRVFALLATLYAAWFVFITTRRISDENSARFTTLLFILSPSYLLMFFISSDAPVVLASLFGVWAFFEAAKQGSKGLAILSGFAFGLGLLSKYLILLPLLGVMVYALFVERRRHLPLLLVSVLSMLPFILQHLYYNYLNCWENLNLYVFVLGQDFFQGPEYPGFKSFLFFLLGSLVVFTPWGLWYYWRACEWQVNKRAKYLFVVILTSLFVMGLISFVSVIGLHFFLVFSPFVFILYSFIKNDRARRWMLRWSYLYAGVWILLFAGILLFPWQR